MRASVMFNSGGSVRIDIIFFTKMCTKRLVNMFGKFWENMLWTLHQIDMTRAKVCISDPDLIGLNSLKEKLINFLVKL